jgi:NAD(P)H-hydrate repair Nnr-like enzyme with NAD(P)H-hydrate dehydratase domain
LCGTGDLGRQLAHHLRGGGDLADGFLLHAQAGEDGGDHHRRHLAAHDLPHQVQHLVVEDFAVLDDALSGLRCW